MKRAFLFLFVIVSSLVIAFALSACMNLHEIADTPEEAEQHNAKPSLSEPETSEKDIGAQTKNQGPVTPEMATATPPPETVKPETTTPAPEIIDVDLTALSNTMIYAEVFNMMVNPNDYIGKTVKMRGSFGIGYSCKPDGTMDEETLVFACVIADATACCSQGIEFVLSGEHAYPDDYPELGVEVTVTGTFELYDENGYEFCRLTDAEFMD